MRILGISGSLRRGSHNTKLLRAAGALMDAQGLELSTTVDRTTFGITWNNPLPSGEPALANEVTLVADLQLVKAA